MKIIGSTLKILKNKWILGTLLIFLFMFLVAGLGGYGIAGVVDELGPVFLLLYRFICSFYIKNKTFKVIFIILFGFILLTLLFNLIKYGFS